MSNDPRLVRSETRIMPSGAKAEYSIYSGVTSSQALQFLKTKTVDAPLVYIVVETPEGTFSRDKDGIYQE